MGVKESPDPPTKRRIMDSTTMKGTVQGYFDRAFDEMTDKELETPTVWPSIPAPPYQRFTQEP